MSSSRSTRVSMNLAMPRCMCLLRSRSTHSYAACCTRSCRNRYSKSLSRNTNPSTRQAFFFHQHARHFIAATNQASTLVEGLPEEALDVFDGHCAELGDVTHIESRAKVRCHLQQFQRLSRHGEEVMSLTSHVLAEFGVGYLFGQVAEVLGHELDHVVRVVHGLHFLQVPQPTAPRVIEPLQPTEG